MRALSPLCLLLFCVFTGAFAVCQEKDQNGEEDLNKAIELNITAATDQDLDEIVDLCESAIKKGLDANSEKLARQLWVSTLYAHAESYATRIFNGDFGERWPPYRRRALTRLEKAVEVDPGFAASHLLIARLNLELPRGDMEAGQRAVDQYIELSGDDKEGLSNGYVFRARLSEDDAETLALLNKAIEANDQNIEALRLRGAKYLTMGAEAIESSEKTPDDEQPEQPNYMDLAIADFKRIAELEPDSPTGLAIVSEALAAQKRYDEALQFADKVVELDPNLQAGYLLRARILQSEEKIDEAIAEAGTAIEKDESSADAYMFRAGLFYEQKSYNDALQDIEKTFELEPRSVRAFYMRSFIHLALENYDNAITDMAVLVQNAQINYRRNPNNPAAYDGLISYTNDYAMIHVAAKKSRIGIQIYEQVLKEDPDNTRALRGRGDAYLNIGDHENAVKDYQAALEITPDDDGILNNYAWVLSTSPDDHIRNGELSLEYALKASELTDYKMPHILSTLASCYAELGNFDKAREWAQKAVELAESDEQRESLQKELDSYLKDEPWRIRESEDESDEDKDKKDAEADTKPQDGDDKKEGGGGDDGDG